jgi:cation diffusion facilitator family transporter
MNLSLGVGVLMLAAKWWAYLLTGSSVIFSDAAESVVHIVAVWFAWYALRVALQPPDAEHHYGHEKIGLISAAVEGGLVCVAAVVIIVSSVERMVTGVELEKLDVGIAITAGAGLVNAVLGWYLMRCGKRNHSLVVVANGQHVLTDAWTSAGAVLGLFLAKWTGWLLFDPILALVFGTNILREGARLVKMSAKGLMDATDPDQEAKAVDALTAFAEQNQITFHQFRLRLAGAQAHVDFHLQFPDDMPIQRAHALATQAEEAVAEAIGVAKVDVISHLEPQTHPREHL